MLNYIKESYNVSFRTGDVGLCSLQLQNSTIARWWLLLAIFAVAVTLAMDPTREHDGCHLVRPCTLAANFR